MKKEITKKFAFGERGLKGKEGATLTPMFCVQLGRAIGNVAEVSRVAVGHDSSTIAKALYHAIVAGLCSSGVQIWDLGQVVASQISFAAAYVNMSACVYVSGVDEGTIELWGSDGLSSSLVFEQAIMKHFSLANSNVIALSQYHDIADMRGFKMVYQQVLTDLAPIGLVGVQAMINCDDRESERMFRDVFLQLGGTIKNRPIFHVSRDGRQVTAIDEKNRNYSSSHLLALGCLLLFEKGEDVAVPYEAPYAIDRLAKHYGRACYRYNYVSDETQYEIRALSKKQYMLRDGMMLTLMILNEMKRRKVDFWELAGKIPPFVERQAVYASVHCPGKDQDTLASIAPAQTWGVGWSTDCQSLRILPQKAKNRWLILAEATHSEIADELCQQTKEKIADLLDRNIEML